MRDLVHFRRALFATILVASPLSGQSPIPPADPGGAVEYFETAERARELYDRGRYAAAESLLVDLTLRMPDDGELWFAIARARHRQGDARRAIEAYRMSLERGFRYAPWMAYQVAHLYAGLGEIDSTLAWLDRSLDLRWDDRPGIAADTAFRELLGHPRFRLLAAIPSDTAPARDEMWRRDLDYLVYEAKRMHAGPERPAHSASFDSAAASIRARIDDLDNDRLLLEMSRLVALLGDGHSGIYGPGSDTPLAFESGTLPLLLYEFTDGLFVIDAVGDARRWIGAEVLRFGEMPAAEAVLALTPYVHHDNAMTVKWLGVRFRLPGLAFLRAIGATDDPTRVTVILRTPDGKTHRVEFQGGPYRQSFRRKLRAPPGARDIPLYLRRVDTNYWLQPLPAHDALYFQFNQVRDAEEGPSIAAFADTLRAVLERTSASNLIVDVRHNNGGNNGLLRPLVRTMVWWEMDEPGRTIYVITGRNTFSAAQNFINRLDRQTGTVFVGEPSSSRPNFVGEETNLTLPYTRIRGSISTRYWQDSDPGDDRPFIAPRVPVGLSAADYFAGRDPALEAITILIGRASGAGGDVGDRRGSGEANARR